MKAPWPIVVAVCSVLAAGGIFVEFLWDPVDHASVDARHAAASALLRSPDVDTRIQAVLALEQVINASPADQPAVTSELSAFIRSVAGSKNCRDYQVGRDVQAALAVLSRRRLAADQDTVVDLHGACLRNAEMANISLVYADLAGADLGGANLNWAVLDGADLSGANFGGANLRYAHVVDARVGMANFAGADEAGIHVRYSR